MTTPSLGAGEWRAERTKGSYYVYAVLAILVALGFIGKGCVSLFSAEEHAYYTSPSCDASLLLAGKQSLAQPCSVVSAVTAFNADGGLKVENDFSDKSELFDRVHAFDRHLLYSYDVAVPGWKDAVEGERIFVQIYKEEDKYVVARLYDPAGKQLFSTSSAPPSNSEEGWKGIRIGLILIAIAAVWIWLGRFMKFETE
jgi:hypothetical protein